MGTRRQWRLQAVFATLLGMETRQPAQHVSLVATRDVIIGTLTGLHDVFNCFGALGWFDEALSRHPPFTVDIVAAGEGPLMLDAGLTLLQARSVKEVTRTDLVIVPSFMVVDGEWQAGRYPELVEWLLAMHAGGAKLCSACSGTLLLAETGLLDGREATMHWAYADTFRRHFPRVTLALEKTLIIEGEHQELVMSGAASSWQDLALYLVARQLGSAVAQAMAKFFAFDLHSDGMAAYSVFSPRFDHGDAERSFQRRFLKATGYSPIQYVQALRLEEAKRLLERTTQPIDAVAWAVGYEDPAFFRRLFKRQTGITPGGHRRKFRMPHATVPP